MTTMRGAIAVLVLMTTSGSAAENFTLPAEITPTLRAACEADVRRLCVSPESTVSSVRRCVILKFKQLGDDCRREIAAAGLTP